MSSFKKIIVLKLVNDELPSEDWQSFKALVITLIKALGNHYNAMYVLLLETVLMYHVVRNGCIALHWSTDPTHKTC